MRSDQNFARYQQRCRQGRSQIHTMDMRAQLTHALASSCICLRVMSINPLWVQSFLISLHMPSTRRKSIHLWHLQLSSSSSIWRLTSPPPRALVDIALSQHSWLHWRCSVTTNFQIGFGQSLAKACSTSRRSTTWSAKCADILTGMSMLSLEPWKGLSIWCGRTLWAWGPILHTFFQPLQNSPPSPHPSSLLWTKTLHLQPFPLTPDPPRLLRTTTNSHNQHMSLLPSHPICLCFVDQTLQVPFQQHCHLCQWVWLTIQLPSLSWTTTARARW